ncbi:hypothetical protein BC749_102379 [Flavobacterium araucananum]|uniref:Uncharacterized protein n=1 Tax=Flavobacterium araucananum TaxID=946678 RepID=A0A227PAR6_9FLAO|nr:hypothetical protein [Flavobacterium araucananum]OXG06474.1 hypothetical protein B0A64_10185 [Flavobacterium araucananum]PWK00812.1 hypothetical protein BC749_102379 [Flavobacterium araucananum]
MEQILKKLNFFIENNLPLILANYTEDDFDMILDQRDEDSFSEKWMEIFNIVKEKVIENNIDKTITDNLREKVFKLVFSLTNHSDLSSYVSDDFGLIVQSIQVKYNDYWLNSLWLEYKKGNLPYENLVETNAELIDLI